MQRPNLIQATVDMVELAGDNNIYVRPVGRVLYKRLQEALTALPELSLMNLDFKRVNFVEPSVLLVSVVKLTALLNRNKWRKAVVCSNTTEVHQAALAMAIEIWPDAANPWGQASPDRLLLLASGRDSTASWRLLGELHEQEKMLWDLIDAEKAGITISELAARLDTDTQTVVSSLQVLTDNGVLFSFGIGEQPSVWAIQNLIPFGLGSTI